MIAIKKEVTSQYLKTNKKLMRSGYITHRGTKSPFEESYILKLENADPVYSHVIGFIIDGDDLLTDESKTLNDLDFDF